MVVCRGGLGVGEAVEVPVGLEGGQLEVLDHREGRGLLTCELSIMGVFLVVARATILKFQV